MPAGLTGQTVLYRRGGFAATDVARSARGSVPDGNEPALVAMTLTTSVLDW
jgi:hypothetical protein